MRFRHRRAGEGARRTSPCPPRPRSVLPGLQRPPRLPLLGVGVAPVARPPAWAPTPSPCIPGLSSVGAAGGGCGLVLCPSLPAPPPPPPGPRKPWPGSGAHVIAASPAGRRPHLERVTRVSRPWQLLVGAEGAPPRRLPQPPPAGGCPVPQEQGQASGLQAGLAGPGTGEGQEEVVPSPGPGVLGLGVGPGGAGDTGWPRLPHRQRLAARGVGALAGSLLCRLPRLAEASPRLLSARPASQRTRTGPVWGEEPGSERPRKGVGRCHP